MSPDQRLERKFAIACQALGEELVKVRLLEKRVENLAAALRSRRRDNLTTNGNYTVTFDTYDG